MKVCKIRLTNSGKNDLTLLLVTIVGVLAVTLALGCVASILETIAGICNNSFKEHWITYFSGTLSICVLTYYAIMYILSWFTCEEE